MELLYTLLVLLVLTRIFGEIAERVGQPVLVGELVSGILLGVVVRSFSSHFPVLSNLTDDHVFRAITDLGIFFLMLYAGLELRPRDMANASGRATLVAFGGMALPLACGVGLGVAFLPRSDAFIPQVAFLGVALAITAVPVSAKVLLDLGKLRSPIGSVIVSAAVLDDVLSLILLAVLTALLETGGMPGPASVGLLLLRVALFFAVTWVVGRFAMPRLGRWIGRARIEELEFSFLLVVALAFSVLAEALGMHFILGAFAAGLFFGRSTVDEGEFEKVERRVSGITKGFLAPVFFASIGLHLDLSAVRQVPAFLGLLILLAVLGKVVGAGLPAYWSGMSRRESLAVGVGMNARGAVELVVADVALRAGLFSMPEPTPEIVKSLFSAVVIVAVLTTLLTSATMRPLLVERTART